MISRKLISAIVLVISFMGISLKTFSLDLTLEDSLLVKYEMATNVEEKITILYELAMLKSFISLDSNCYDIISSAKWEFLKKSNITDIELPELNQQLEDQQIALNYLLESQAYFDDCECDSLKAEVYLSLGRFYVYQNNYSEAQENFIHGLELLEKTDNHMLLSRYYAFIGIMYVFMENYEDAENYLIKSSSRADTLLQNEGTAFVFYAMGIVDYLQGNFSESRHHLTKALVLKDKFKSDYTEIYLYIFLGDVDLELGEYEDAINNYIYAEELLKNTSSAYALIYSYQTASLLYSKGRYYHLTSNNKEALTQLAKALSIAKMKGHYLLVSEVYGYFGLIHEQQGKFKQAIYYYRTSYQVKDSILNSYNVTRVTKLEMQYQHLKELNQKRLNRIKMEQEYQNKVRTYKWLGLSGALLLIIIVLIFIIYRIKARASARSSELEQKKLTAEKDVLQNELEYKNRELTTSVMYLLRKNNFIWNLSLKIKKAILNLKAEDKNHFLTIIQEMDSSMSTDAWEDFEARFNNVHQDFNDNLLKDFPELTPNELKLCAFLKLNMTSKDIATITYQSINSITVARHRLRSKLGLDRDDNLTTFLAKY